MWKRVTEYLSILKCVRPPHIYVSVFAAISAGAFGTQSGLISLPFIKGPPPLYQGPSPSPSFEFRGFTSIALKARFDRLGYSLTSVRAGKSDVPRLFITQLPEDFPQVKSTTERKNLFLRGVLPLVLRVNERLSRDRSRLLQIEQHLKTRQQLSEGDAAWLANQEELYSVEPGDLRSLLLRVDQVPLSLALAQAAIESGWGTSRFATLGNALFGQWTENPNVRGYCRRIVAKIKSTAFEPSASSSGLCGSTHITSIRTRRMESFASVAAKHGKPASHCPAACSH